MEGLERSRALGAPDGHGRVERGVRLGTALCVRLGAAQAREDGKVLGPVPGIHALYGKAGETTSSCFCLDPQLPLFPSYFGQIMGYQWVKRLQKSGYLGHFLHTGPVIHAPCQARAVVPQPPSGKKAAAFCRRFVLRRFTWFGAPKNMADPRNQWDPILG